MVKILKQSILFLAGIFSLLVGHAQTITSTGSMNTARWFHQSVLLTNGNVLVCGGENGNALAGFTYNSAEIYNVTTGTWSYTGSMKEKRVDFSAIMLNNGKILVIGGHPYFAFGDGKRSCELYDPATGIWTYADSMNYSRYHHAAIKLNDGKVLVAGGYSDNKTSEIYNPDTNKWTITGNLNNILNEHSSTVKLSDGSILTTNERSGEIYNPITGLWTPIIAPLNGTRRSHSSVLLNNGNVLLSGSTFSSDQNSAEIFDPVSETFNITGSMSEYRANSPAIIMDNGKVLAFGLGDIFNSANSKLIEVFDPLTGLWTSNIYNRIGTQGYTIQKLNNGKILVVGGSFTTGNGATNGCALIDQNIGPCSNPNISLLASGGLLCENSNGLVKVLSSETGVSYQAYIGNTAVSNVIAGGGDISLNVNANFIRSGINVVSIQVQKNSCPFVKLQDTASLHIFQPQITSFFFQICNGDSVLLKAPSGFNSYLWSNGATTESIKIKTDGFFSVQVNNGICMSPASIIKQVVVKPIVNTSLSISISNGSNPSTSGTPITFTAAPVNGGKAAFLNWKLNGSLLGVNSIGFTSSTLTDNDIVSCEMTADTVCPSNLVSFSNTYTISLLNAPGIISRNPVANSCKASSNHIVTTTFSRTMSLASAHDTVITVRGSRTGKLQGVFNSNNSATISFDPIRSFFPGEKIQVSIKSKAKTISGDSLSKSYVSEFTTSSATSSGTFFTSLPAQPCAAYPSQIASADFDNDGDVDIAIAATFGIVTIGKNNGAGVFTNTNITIGANSNDILVEDFNNDGYADIAVVNYNIIVAINDGSGNFPTLKTSSFTGSPSVWRSYSGDFNGDGFMDIAMADKSAGIHVFVNKGDAMFTRTGIITVIQPQAVASGDIDLDGDIDLVTTNANSTFSILLNDGKANYALYSSIITSPGGRAIELEDIDDDGDLDIITSNFTTANTVSIRKNIGSLSFATSLDISMGSLAGFLCVADFDGDGDPDIATGNDNTVGTDISVIYNNGTGSFSHSVNHSNGVSPKTRGICSADFNGDGKLDLALVNFNLNSFNLRLNIPPVISTSFVPDSYYCAGSTFVVPFTTAGNFLTGNSFQVELSDAAGDFTNPIVIATGAATPLNAAIPSTQLIGSNYTIRIVSTFPRVVSEVVSTSFIVAECPSVSMTYPASNQINIPVDDESINITFNQAMNINSFNSSSFRVTGSLQGNIPGSFLVGSSSNIIRFIPSRQYKAGEKVSVTMTSLLKNSQNQLLLVPKVIDFKTKSAVASGNLSFASRLKDGEYFSCFLEAGYFKDPSHLDIISYPSIVASYMTKATYYMNDGPGTFFPAEGQVNSRVNAIGDFDNDNDLDLIGIGETYGTIKVYWNNQSTPNFTTSTTSIFTPEYNNIKAADINGDGYLDLIATDATNRVVRAYKNDGVGNFSLSSSLTISDAPFGLDVIDLDNDGDIDIVTGNTNANNITIILNNGKGVFSIKSTMAASKEARTIRCIDIDNDQDADIVAGHLSGSDFSIYYNNGNAVFTNVNYATAGITQDFQLADIDGDGDFDIVQAVYNSNSILTHKNNGSGLFSPFQTISHKSNSGLVLADIDEDGDQDMIVSTIGTYAEVYINGDYIKTSSINTNICLPQTSIPVSYTCSTSLNPGNVFSAQLSDKYGSFANPTVIGSLNSDVSGVINVNIPVSTPSGNAYRIRVVSSNPVLPAHGSNDSLNIASQLPVFSSSISGPDEICYTPVNADTYSLPFRDDLKYTWESISPYYTKKYKNEFKISWGFGADTLDILCTVSNGCGSLPQIKKRVIKYIYVGAGAITGVASVCSNQKSVSYSILPVNGTKFYNWTVPSGASIVSGEGTNSILVNFGSNGGNVTVSVGNACGTNSPATLSVDMGPAAAATIISGTSFVCTSQTNALYILPSVKRAISYNWTLPPGATIVSGANTNIVYINFSAASSGILTVTPISACGNGAPASIDIVVHGTIPGAAGKISGEGIPCVFQNGVGYSIAPVLNAAYYNWSIPIGASIVTGVNTNNVTVNFGSSFGKIIVTPSNGCGVGTSSSINLNTNNLSPYQPGPIVGSIVVCPNQSGVVYSIDSSWTVSRYAWSVPIGASIVSGINTKSITVNFGINPGEISVVGFNGCGTGLPSRREISMGGSSAVASPIIGSSKVCQNQVSLAYSINAVAGAIGYNWTVPSGASIVLGANSQNIFVNFGSTAGTITVTPKFATCSDGVSSSLDVGTKNLTDDAGIITGLVTLCANASDITYSISSVTNASSYNWTVPPGSIITQGSNTSTIKMTYGGVAGYVTVVPTNTCGNGASSSITINTYSGSCILPIAQNINGPASAQQGTTVTYSVLPASSGSSYNWKFPLGTTIVSANSDSSTTTIIMGSFSGDIILKETNTAGTTTNILYINSTPPTNIIDELSTELLEAYPLPFDEFVMLNIKANGNYALQIRVLDTKGVEVLKSLDFYTNQTFTFGSQLNAGIYYAEIKFDEFTKVIRLVKI